MITNNLFLLLDDGNKVFKQFHALMKESDHEAALTLLNNAPQPASWSEEMDSDILEGKYRFNKIQLIEAVMDQLFSYWRCEIIHPIIITQSKEKFASTVSVELSCYVRDSDGDKVLITSTQGVATVYAPNIEGLTLATPRAFTEAKKHAIRQLGAFLGRDLNRDKEDASTVEQRNEEDSDAFKKEYEIIKGKLDTAKNRQEAFDIIEKSFGGNYKHNVDLKNIAMSKPNKN